MKRPQSIEFYDKHLVIHNWSQTHIVDYKDIIKINYIVWNVKNYLLNAHSRTPAGSISIYLKYSEFQMGIPYPKFYTIFFKKEKLKEIPECLKDRLIITE